MSQMRLKDWCQPQSAPSSWWQFLGRLDVARCWARLECAYIYRVLNTPGVQQIVGHAGPTTIEDETIESLEKAFSNEARIHPAEYLRHGDVVQVTQGPMQSATGLLVRTKDSVRLVIQVNILQRSVLYGDRRGFGGLSKACFVCRLTTGKSRSGSSA